MTDCIKIAQYTQKTGTIMMLVTIPPFFLLSGITAITFDTIILSSKQFGCVTSDCDSLTFSLFDMYKTASYKSYLYSIRSGKRMNGSVPEVSHNLAVLWFFSYISVAFTLISGPDCIYAWLFLLIFSIIGEGIEIIGEYIELASQSGQTLYTATYENGQFIELASHSDQTLYTATYENIESPQVLRSYRLLAWFNSIESNESNESKSDESKSESDEATIILPYQRWRI